MGNSTLKFFDMVQPDDFDPFAKLNEITLSIGKSLAKQNVRRANEKGG